MRIFAYERILLFEAFFFVEFVCFAISLEHFCGRFLENWFRKEITVYGSFCQLINLYIFFAFLGIHLLVFFFEKNIEGIFIFLEILLFLVCLVSIFLKRVDIFLLSIIG